MSTAANTPAKVGPCPTCSRPDAEFSKTQWKKNANLRKCIACVSAGAGESLPLKSDNANDGGSKPQDEADSEDLMEEEKVVDKDEGECKVKADGKNDQDDVTMDATPSKAAAPAQPEVKADSSKTDNENDKPSSETQPDAPEDESDQEGNWSPIQSEDEPTPKKQSIRDKMKRSRQDTLHPKKRHKPNDDSSEDEHRNISVEHLKRQILGRSINSYNVDSESHQFTSEGPTIMDASTFVDGTSVADHLKSHLSCPICFERLYNPVSLMCGHSFCKNCLIWWLDRGNANANTNSDEEVQTLGTCPTCRHPILGQNKNKLQINTALKACMDTLYGNEMNQRRLAELREVQKSTRGENGGMHERGCEEIVSLKNEDEISWGRNGMVDEENGWGGMFAGRKCRVFIRRNIVLDECSQQHQLCLGFTKCDISKTIVDVELCLLKMEEDEIDDSGFPTLITEGSDDEALICTDVDRIHSCIVSSVRIAPAAVFEEFSCFKQDSHEESIKEVSLSRGMIGMDGSVRFRIDVGRVLEDEAEDNSVKDPRLIKLIFCHVDTGARLELRTPVKSGDDINTADDASDEVEFAGMRKRGGRNAASRFVKDAYDKEEEEEYDDEHDEDDDGFIVGSDEDEDDGCDICNHGGDLIVCDGGDNEGGCGKSFHLECINRKEIPPGDWICSACAKEVGFDVDIKGYEYAPDDSAIEIHETSDEESKSGEPNDQLEDTPVKPPKKIRKKKSRHLTIGSDDSDAQSDDDQSNKQLGEGETPVGNKKKSRNKSKKEITIGSDDSDNQSDEEDKSSKPLDGSDEANNLHPGDVAQSDKILDEGTPAGNGKRNGCASQSIEEAKTKDNADKETPTWNNEHEDMPEKQSVDVADEIQSINEGEPEEHSDKETPVGHKKKKRLPKKQILDDSDEE